MNALRRKLDQIQQDAKEQNEQTQKKLRWAFLLEVLVTLIACCGGIHILF